MQKTRECSISITAWSNRAVPACLCGRLGQLHFTGHDRFEKASQYLLDHLEEEYQVKLNGSNTNCPACSEDLELEENDAILLRENQPSVVNCKNGHEFDAYLVNGTLFLFTENDSTHSPFSTSP